MRQPTHYPESMSGPREPKFSAPCVICGDESVTQCDSCVENICQECSISCAKCPQDNPYCIQCAIKRGAYEQIGDGWYCENHAADFEPEVEMARRVA